MNIAIIPARGGSKRIPRKNIKNFHGKPIIAYSIEIAKKSGCFDRIIVSTDDDEIATVARAYGAEVPFMRPADVSDDHATTNAVIQHSIGELKLEDNDNLCCIYATAPFLESSSIKEGLDQLKNNNIKYSFTATEYSFPIQRGFYLNDEGGAEMYHPEHLNTRSQDLTRSFHDAGQIYWGAVSAFRKGLGMFESHSKPIILNPLKVQDIDTLADWEYAEALYTLLSR